MPKQGVHTECGGNLLMIFVKNTEEGKVKTRLAKDVGDKKALDIYKLLLDHTKEVALEVPFFRMVFYSDYIDFADTFPNEYFLKDEQAKGDIGERMLWAFKENFAEQYDKIICIGSDCYELTSKSIADAFDLLDENDVVIGPAKDGGYYLIGMKKMYASFFENKEWSTPNVLLDTLLDVQQQGLKYTLLPTLSDIDEISDLGPELKAVID